MLTAIAEKPVAKSKADDHPKRYGTLIRVTDEFAEAVRTAASFEKMSIAEYAKAHLLPVVQRRHRDAILREAKRIQGRDD